MSTGRSEDEAWRSIVDNFGDRARLDDEPPEPPDDPAADPRSTSPAGPGPVVAAGTTAAGVWTTSPRSGSCRRSRRRPRGSRCRSGWRGWPCSAAPRSSVVALLVSYDLPSLVGYALVAGFLGGFGYLVATMQRADERNPWDDGAQL